LPSLLLLVACGQETPDDGVRTWSTFDDFCYQLQNIDLAELGATHFDVAIIDYSRDGAESGRFAPADIAGLKSSPGGPKLVLCYLSIGEAEDYRWYWSEEWDANNDGTPDPGAPDWLGPSNPDWPGNYKVKYWDPGWQQLMLGDSAYLDRVVAGGFDGVYLDIIDAYEYWGPGGESGLDRPTAEAEMVAFVQAVAARAVARHPGFAVFPQNGEQLGRHPEYLAVVTGIGREDVWYDGSSPQEPTDTAAVTADLDRFRAAGKAVLVIDYVSLRSQVDEFYARARSRGYVPYATRRELDRLTINEGHEPD